MNRPAGFRRRQRLGSAAVSAVLGGGQRRRSHHISLQVRTNGLSFARFAVIVPKRHVPRAVDRNRVKRLLREWFRHRQQGLSGKDVLIRVTQPLDQNENVLSELHRLLPEIP